MPTKLFRILYQGSARLLVERDGNRHLLSPETTLGVLLSQKSLCTFRETISGDALPDSIQYLPPIEDQEVWGCGVTYFSSRRARMAETSPSEASIYDRVYSAERPQVFPKARGRNVITTGQPVLLRTGSNWIVPEPELVLVINSHGSVVGVTIGNDVSSRDIEGQNPLYQPQAKIWDTSCAIGPSIELSSDVSAMKKKQIRMCISRQGEPVFEGSCAASQIARSFDLLVQTLFECRSFPDGAYLFTGTGIVPPDSFLLQSGDSVRISANGLEELSNEVSTFSEKRPIHLM